MTPEKFILSSRRFWQAISPLLVIVLGALGLPVAADALDTGADKLFAAATTLIAVSQFFLRNPISRENLVGKLMQRTTWLAALPAIAVVSQWVGHPISEQLLASTGDQLWAAFVSVLGLARVLFPDTPSGDGAKLSLRRVS